MAAVVGAPVILVGGVLYISGKAASNWLAEHRHLREERRLKEAERRRLEAADREQEDRAIAQFDAQVAQGNLPLVQALTALSLAADEEAVAADRQLLADFPYKGLQMKTQVPGYKHQNDFDSEIVAAYEELWKDPAWRSLLSLVTPMHFKALIAWESKFDEAFRSQCGHLALRCKVGKRRRSARSQGVGLTAIVYRTANGTGLGGLRIDQKVDERLEVKKAIRAGLNILNANLHRIQGKFDSHGVVPDKSFLRDLTLLSYNTSPNSFEPAISDASVRWKLDRDKIRIEHLLKSPDGHSPPLQVGMGKGRSDDAAANEKFQKEASRYLAGITMWYEAAQADRKIP